MVVPSTAAIAPAARPLMVPLPSIMPTVRSDSPASLPSSCWLTSPSARSAASRVPVSSIPTTVRIFFRDASNILLPQRFACDRGISQLDGNGANDMDIDDKIDAATEYHLEQGITEEAARRLARNAVADGEDAAAQDTWEAGQ